MAPPKLYTRCLAHAACMALGFAIVLVPSVGLSQDSDSPLDLDLSEGEQSLANDFENSTDEAMLEFIEDLRSEEAPEGSQEYGELYQMRVLERQLLPGSSQETSKANLTIPAGDPLSLSHDAALGLLLRDASSLDASIGLQRQSTRLMTMALEQVRQQIRSASGSQRGSSSLNLPFGLDCLDEASVREYLALYSAPGASTIKVWLKRAGRWEAVVEKIMKEEGVPSEMLYLAMIESGFKTRVKSPASAGGMWQFMPATGREMGLKIDDWVDERFDPIKSAHAAARYLKKQYARYNSWPLAMAAYNGGPGTVNVAIDRYNTTNYFKLVEYGAMYDETRRYVPKILAAAIIGKNKEAFGFDGLVAESPITFDSVSVNGGDKLSLLAEAAGCSVDSLKELNPELLREQTPPGSPYILRIPRDKHDTFVANYDRVSKNYGSERSVIRVKFGQSLEAIAELYDVPTRVLRSLNGLGARDSVPYGSEIYIPKGAKAKAKEPVQEGSKILALVTPTEFVFRDKKCVFYETQRGDELAAIAKAFGVMPTALALWNDLDSFAKLRPNMMLQVFVAPDKNLDDIIYYNDSEVSVVTKGSDAHKALISARSKAVTSSRSTSSSSSSSTHTVVKGDSLSKVASKYGISIKELEKLNKIKAGSTLRVGQKLRVKK